MRWVKHLGLPHLPYRGKLTADAEERLRELLAERPLASYRELAEVLKVHQWTVRGWIKRLGLPHPPCHRELTPELESRLRALVAEKPLASYRELSGALEVPTATVMRWVKHLGLPHLEYVQKMTLEKQAQLRSLVAENPLVNYQELSRALRIPSSTIHYWVGRLKIPAPYRGFKGKITPEKDALLRSLVAKNPAPTYQELAEALCIDKATVFKWVKRLGIPLHGHRRKITPDNEERLRRLVTERPQANFRELARVMQLSPTIIQHWVKRLALPHHDGRK
jgi:transposase